MGTYVQLSNVRTWYEEQGDGPPLVLIHGGAVDSRFFSANIGPLAEHFHVYAIDLRGHGHTADVEGPFTYDAYTQDTVEFIEGVIGGPAHLVGHSVGGAVALFTTLARPDLVDQLVLISTGFHYEGEVGAGGGDIETNVRLTDEFLGETYAEVSPDGRDHFPVVVRKDFELSTREPALQASDLGVIDKRTLVMLADDDIMTLEHNIEMYRAIPRSELAVVPGASHFLVQEKPEAVNRVIIDFLGNEPVATVAPIRRAPQPTG